MKTQDYVDFFAARTDDNQAALAALTEKAENAQSDELTALNKEISVVRHRLRFLSMLTRNVDEIAKVSQQLRLSTDVFTAIERDAKSLAKASDVMLAVARTERVSTKDDALSQAVDHLIKSDFADITREQMRQKLYSKKSNYTEAHTTHRQAAMCLDLFRKLNTCSVTEKAQLAQDDVYSFNADSAIVKRLSEAYS